MRIKYTAVVPLDVLSLYTQIRCPHTPKCAVLIPPDVLSSYPQIRCHLLICTTLRTPFISSRYMRGGKENSQYLRKGRRLQGALKSNKERNVHPKREQMATKRIIQRGVGINERKGRK